MSSVSAIQSIVAICLQETHIKDESRVSFKGYTPYNQLDHLHERASGGSSVLIRNDVIHSPMKLSKNLQAVAVKITLSFVFTVCSIYAPPNQYIDIKDLEHLLSQINETVMILGDFNAHNPLWGSDTKPPKVRPLRSLFVKMTFIFIMTVEIHFFILEMAHILQLICLLQALLFLIVFHGKSMMIAVVVTISQLF